jgi:hypothetical protein
MADQIAADVINKMQDGTLSSANVVDIVKYIAKAVKGDREAAIEVVAILSRGADGVPGTPDDVIPLTTAEALKALINNALVGQLVGELYKTRCRCWSG